MYQFTLKLHPILTILLLVIYAFLAWRWWTLKEKRPSVLMRTLAHVSRFFLLLLYLDGFMLTNYQRLPVGEYHHLAALLPVLVIFFFQFLPSLLKKPLTAKKQGLMWMAMFVCIIIIAGMANF